MSLNDLLFLLMSRVALLINRASSLLMRSEVRSSRAEVLDSICREHYHSWNVTLIILSEDNLADDLPHELLVVQDGLVLLLQPFLHADD